eukprot:GFKZ01010310.1.p2 GENE.GFKZ01010310.1~~GFKZ01010310.1.p2  ORF type:complete len:234 (-),score=56.84 GFKZ01010310.1:894-1595(-)
MPPSIDSPPDSNNIKWSSDHSRFGYRMLQKMGWREGKGLGANEDGATEHIRVQKKMSTSGVGSRGANAVWEVPAKVAAGLNSVLAGLQKAGAEKDRMKFDEERVVERKRGYYGRRRAGKCVGNYSREALEEIFGGGEFEAKGHGEIGADGNNGERLKGARVDESGEGAEGKEGAEAAEGMEADRERRRVRRKEKKEKRREKESKKSSLKAGKKIKKSTGKKAKKDRKATPSDR